jgi:hypothetical protein
MAKRSCGFCLPRGVRERVEKPSEEPRLSARTTAEAKMIGAPSGPSRPLVPDWAGELDLHLHVCRGNCHATLT